MYKISQLLFWSFLYVTTAPKLTPRCRRLLEKLIVHLVKKFPTFYGTRSLITAFTRARHYPLSRARSIQPTPSHLRLDLPSGLLLCLIFIHQNPLCTSPLPCATWPAHLTHVFGWCQRPSLISLNLRISLPLPEIACSISIIHCFPAVH